MWVNRALFDLILEDNKRQQERIVDLVGDNRACLKSNLELSTQKHKDDITIDWLRNRVNALEKERNILLQRAAGIILPTPEIVVTIPNRVSDMNTLPTFEDVGDEEASRLGIITDPFPTGELTYAK